MNIPCVECICLPICRHKRYHQLNDDCSKVKEYLVLPYDISPIRDARIVSLESFLKPSLWGIVNTEHDHNGGFIRVTAYWKKIKGQKPRRVAKAWENQRDGWHNYELEEL